jgi:4-amino-4-deoxy-L-arabinose transferase-like glycosyltransferase
MNAVTTPPRKSRVTDRVLADGWGKYRTAVLFLLVVAIFAVLTILWDIRWRHDQPFDLDESGFLNAALADFHALQSGGPVAWVKQVLSPSSQSPLMPALSTPFFLIFGANGIGALLTPLALMVVAIGLTFGLARRTIAAPASWLTLAMIVTTPAIINYSRFYIFAAAATAAIAAALYTFHRTQRLQNIWWSCLFGVALGFLPLSRTMTVSFLPAFVIVTLLAIWQADARVIAFRNAAAAAAVAFVVAATWLLTHRNYASVGHYLTSFGYGASSGSFGRSHSLLSYGAWDQVWSTFVRFVYLPHSLLYLCGAGLILVASGARIRHAGWRQGVTDCLKHPLFPSALLVLEGFAALASSSNEGDGFPVPLIVPLSLLAGWSLHRYLRHLSGAAPVLVSTAGLMAVAPSLPWASSLASTWYAQVPTLGHAKVTSGQGLVQRVEAWGLHTGANLLTSKELALGSAWIRANQTTVARIASTIGTRTFVAIDFEHYLMNSYSLNLTRAWRDKPALSLTQLYAEQVGTTNAEFVRWLTKGAGSSACFALSPSGIEDSSMHIGPEVMDTAQRQAGFTRVTSWPLPNGELLYLWRRVSASCSARSYSA